MLTKDEKYIAIINKYYQLRQEIEDVLAKLYELHQDKMVCGESCSSCCMNFSIFPVEFFAILNEIKDKKTEIKDVSEEECIFLKDKRCLIYPSRPIICRTHGFPLLYVNEEHEEWELSVCPMNFTSLDTDEFTAENTFPQDLFYNKLFLINKEFVEHLEKREYDEFTLMELSSLKKYL